MSKVFGASKPSPVFGPKGAGNNGNSEGPRVIQAYFPGGRLSETIRGWQARVGQRSVVQARGADKGHAFQTPPGFLKSRALGSGQPLQAMVKSQMESFFQTDFSNVRVHVGPEAPSIGALAFTVGTNLYFAPGQYQPNTPGGRQLIGHELTHVVQQAQGRVSNPYGSGMAVVHDPGLEEEAEKLGKLAAVHAGRGRPVGKPAVQRPPTAVLRKTLADKQGVKRAGGYKLIIGAYQHPNAAQLPEALKGHSFVSIVQPSGERKTYGFSPAHYGKYDPRRDFSKLRAGVQGVVHADEQALSKPGVKLSEYEIGEEQAQAAMAKVEEYRAGKYRYNLMNRQCSKFAMDVLRAANGVGDFLLAQTRFARGELPANQYGKGDKGSNEIAKEVTFKPRLLHAHQGEGAKAQHRSDKLKMAKGRVYNKLRVAPDDQNNDTGTVKTNQFVLQSRSISGAIRQFKQIITNQNIYGKSQSEPIYISMDELEFRPVSKRDNSQHKATSKNPLVEKETVRRSRKDIEARTGGDRTNTAPNAEGGTKAWVTCRATVQRMEDPSQDSSDQEMSDAEEKAPDKQKLTVVAWNLQGSRANKHTLFSKMIKSVTVDIWCLTEVNRDVFKDFNKNGNHDIVGWKVEDVIDVNGKGRSIKTKDMVILYSNKLKAERIEIDDFELSDAQKRPMLGIHLTDYDIYIFTVHLLSGAHNKNAKDISRFEWPERCVIAGDFNINFNGTNFALDIEESGYGVEVPSYFTQKAGGILDAAIHTKNIKCELYNEKAVMTLIRPHALGQFKPTEWTDVSDHQPIAFDMQLLD